MCIVKILLGSSKKRKVYILLLIPIKLMKHILSVSLDEATIAKLRSAAKNSKNGYRNTSHFVEEAVLKLLEGED